MRLGLAVVVLIGFLGCQAEQQKTVEVKTKEEKLSYSIGVDVGKRLKDQPFEIVTPALMQGVQDALEGKEIQLTDAEMRESFEALQREQQEEQQAAQKKEMDENETAGAAFLAENKGKEGVVTLENGLQYKVVKKGTGKSPTLESKVVAHYRGTLIDGTQFDSSYDRGEPTEFPLKNVIKGWQEALMRMKEGGKWTVWIPPDLGYGPRGAPGSPIGPNSTLVFDIELVEVK